MDANSHQQYRQKLKNYAFVIIFSGSLLTILSLYLYRQVNDKWSLYLKESSEVYSLHDSLVQQLGYGGFIHDFKNLIIRKDIARYDQKISSSLSNIHMTIRKLESFTEYNPASIQNIRQVVVEYELNYELAKSLLAQGLSSEEIDQRVKVDDTPALLALQAFDKQIKQKLELESQGLSQSFMLAFLVHALSIMSFIALLLFYFQRLMAANKTEQKLTDKAISATQAKSDFLANMSHEVRTPLNGIMGSLQLLENKVTEAESKKLVKQTLFSTRTLLTILNDILDFSKIEANQLTLENIDFSVKEVVGSVVSDMQPNAENKDLFIDIQFSEKLHDIWLGDPVRIRQIILNLVSNAVKFTEHGSISVSVYERDQHLFIEVLDTGIGMAEEAANSLFERFSQADTTVTRKFGGTGLGMAIAQNLVELMSGNITVSSELNKGSQFIVCLPLKKSEKQLQQTKEQHKVIVPDLEGKSILVAEDNLVNRTIVDSMLKTTKATIHFAENGVIALELYKKKRPDMIFMDIQMPEMDGIEACAAIRKLDSKLPIVALTANVMASDIERYQQTGFTDHLGKPLELSDFYRVLTEHLIS